MPEQLDAATVRKERHSDNSSDVGPQGNATTFSETVTYISGIPADASSSSDYIQEKLQLGANPALAVLYMDVIVQSLYGAIAVYE